MIGTAISKFILKVWGWKIIGNYPYEIPKKIFVVAPHTSNWDFPVGLLLRSAVNDHIKFVGKKSLFKPPLGWIMYYLGGIPVDRTERNSFVQSVVELFNTRERLAISLAPEGTRKKVGKFKTGYYFISVQSGVPIIPTVFNWKDKEIVFMDPIHLRGDGESEMEEIENLFKIYVGRNPENSFK